MFSESRVTITTSFDILSKITIFGKKFSILDHFQRVNAVIGCLECDIVCKQRHGGGRVLVTAEAMTELFIDGAGLTEGVVAAAGAAAPRHLARLLEGDCLLEDVVTVFIDGVSVAGLGGAQVNGVHLRPRVRAQVAILKIT